MRKKMSQRPLKTLLTRIPRGAPLDTATLKRYGISIALTYHYVRVGWLMRLGRGVFALTGDKLERDRTFRFFAGKVVRLHVGGKTALIWRGLHCGKTGRELIRLWGRDAGVRIPSWLNERFPCRYTSASLFSSKLHRYYGLKHLPTFSEGPLVSEAERALLEMLSQVGIGQDIDEARFIVGNLKTLNEDTLTVLLRHCVRIKVLRLCVAWAEEFNLGWARAARIAARGKLRERRWFYKFKNGTKLGIRVRSRIDSSRD